MRRVKRMGEMKKQERWMGRRERRVGKGKAGKGRDICPTVSFKSRCQCIEAKKCSIHA